MTNQIVILMFNFHSKPLLFNATCKYGYIVNIFLWFNVTELFKTTSRSVGRITADNLSNVVCGTLCTRKPHFQLLSEHVMLNVQHIFVNFIIFIRKVTKIWMSFPALGKLLHEFILSCSSTTRQRDSRRVDVLNPGSVRKPWITDYSNSTVQI